MPFRRIALLAALALAPATPALAAPAGAYKGKIAHQGYDITFTVKGSKITKIRARMLQDCGGDGLSEVYYIAPDASWTIRGSKFSGKKKETYSGVQTTVTFEGTVSRSGAVKGHVRAVDFIDGVGIVCDTLKRTFTARRR